MKCFNMFCVFNENEKCLKEDITIDQRGNCSDIFLPNVGKNVFRSIKKNYRNPPAGLWGDTARRARFQYNILQSEKKKYHTYNYFILDRDNWQDYDLNKKKF